MAYCCIHTPPSTSSDTSHNSNRSLSRGRRRERALPRTSPCNKRRKIEEHIDIDESRGAGMNAPALPHPGVYDSPVGSRKRSTSPAKQLRHLESASPRLNFLDRTQVPAGPMLLLRTKIARATRSGYLPSQLRTIFDDRHLVDFEEPETLFSDDLIGTMSTHTLQSRVGAIMTAAHRCATRSRDEAAWSQVVYAILQLALELDDDASTNEREFEILDV